MQFRTPIRVCFSDIDNAGIVYYPRFLHYFHLAVEEFFGGVLDVDFADVLHVHNLGLPTVHVEADFLRKLKYGDHIDMEVEVVDLGRSSITWGYRGYRGSGGELVVKGSNTTVCVHLDTFEKIQIPPWLRHGLETYQNGFDRAMGT